MIILFRLLSVFPLGVLQALGSVCGWVVWLCSSRYRQNFNRHIGQAGLQAARRRAIRETGKTIFELPKIWLRPNAEVVRRVTRVSGWELIDAGVAAGRGIVLLTPHLGCFEITAQYCASHRPITVLYRRAKQAWLAPLVEAGRGANLKLAPADLSGVRRLLKALKNGETIGLLPDQAPGTGEGIWAPFFGRPAYTMTLAARLADTGATVLMIYAERLTWGRGYHVHVQALSAPLIGDLAARTAQINGEIEQLIRRCPGQYLWAYNRYKTPAGAEPPPDSVATPRSGVQGMQSSSAPTGGPT
ncbi:MAG: lysophospholipid acyltransferase family protein [Rhodocyclaceae bacterium]|nr:lysophospholipid acyltransferase family protein [Rhodocyclaceae bacterium]MBK9623698.1 lysophospholipid acyltransferase family protein [Rhodocyclaceae bacterium]MBL0075299.1 lysophospholipid acyltransferase family protein [Rhodocyclaceae bacterium]MBP6108426.1 lysophospholipid acyltransferase family protein [Rhodocyclaceae bacterium]MBP6278247.1 lysophospholipid acyltransferase family protein [Rhodocyclaceae bacterium]